MTDPFAAFMHPGEAVGYDEADIPAPTHWADIPAGTAPQAWAELRAWVETLQYRFGLDHHVLPACWWRHNPHVEALAALRDHEAASYLDTAPATAPVDWLRAFRDVTALLRAWTGDLGCDTTHRPGPDPGTSSVAFDEAGWAEHVDADTARRRSPETSGSPKAADE
jgi:hypothetical protein